MECVADPSHIGRDLMHTVGGSLNDWMGQSKRTRELIPYIEYVRRGKVHVQHGGNGDSEGVIQSMQT